MNKSLNEQDHKFPFGTTIDYSGYPEFAERAHILFQPNYTLWDEIKSILRLLKAGRKEKVLLLDCASGHIHPDLLATVGMGFWPKSRRPIIFFVGAMWQKDPGIRGIIQKVILQLADRSIKGYIPLSTDEIPIFSRTWEIPELKLHHCPYFFTFTQEDLKEPAPPRDAFVFSGGNTMRDYEPYLEAITSMPEHQFVIATKLLQGRKLPQNLQAKPVHRSEFIRLMRASSAVVVPMRKDLNRSAGQQTYLNAMMLGKITIVSNTFGVRDHVEDQKTALVVDGTPESYIRSLRWALDPANRAEVETIIRNAQQVVTERFTFENHAKCVLDTMDSLSQAS